jgi:hypothetical protein
MPLVIQFNKRDLPDIRSDAELQEMARRGREPVYRAIAKDGEGVLETFMGLLQLSWLTLDRVHSLGQKLKVDGDALLAAAAAQLGAKESVAELLERRLGGELKALGEPAPTSVRGPMPSGASGGGTP